MNAGLNKASGKEIIHDSRHGLAHSAPALGLSCIRLAFKLRTIACALVLISPAFSQPIDIQLQHGSESEQKTKVQLEKLLQSYDLHRWTFTRKVLIDYDSIPHSHPVLTLHTRHLGSDDQLLSTYVHEQLHWWLDAKIDQTNKAEDELRKLYPKVPVGFPEGAQDEESTYLHLIDCYLEMQADRALMGDQRAAEVMKFWSGDHYRWVYRTVIQDETKIADVVKKNKLEVN
jgi:hypothetical protein